MRYPLRERIGNPELLIGRKKEFADLHKWVRRMPMELSRSIALLARKKSGKTAILQRLFNELWSAGDSIMQDPNGMPIIPIYMEIGDKGVWYPDFATRYYRIFASQYISYLERDESMVRTLLDLKAIRDYGEKNSIRLLVRDVESLWEDKEKGFHDSMWETASWAPHRFASLYDQRIVVMIDEFQNISEYVFIDEAKTNPDRTMPGSYHELSESKVAPMLVTGSYVGWLVNLINKYLEGGRLEQRGFSPYLTKEEGLEAVYQYARFYEEPINNATAALINELCMSDPFFISCVVDSQFAEKDLTSVEGVLSTVNHEISHRKARLANTWAEYINNAVDRINDQYAKMLLMHLSKYSGRPWTHLELKEELNLDLDPKEILRKLLSLVDADLIEEGETDISFQGLQDGTLYMVLRKRFEGEIDTFPGNLKNDLIKKQQELMKNLESLRGKYSDLTGKVAEEALATALRFNREVQLSDWFSFPQSGQEPETAEAFHFSKVRTRLYIQTDEQHPDPGKNRELDVVADAESGQTLLVELKKRKETIGIKVVREFLEKAQCFARLHPEREVLLAFFSAGDFTSEAKDFCDAQNIGTATEFFFFKNEWNLFQKS